jgi:AcrR family transcriptional regulator
MSWSKEDKEGPRGYHHGNLKEALMRAALELIAQKGPAGFTFAEAARWAGVSPAAPYRHFRDRDELLGEHRAARLRAIRGALAQAWDDGRPDVFVAFDRLGKAYLGFARTEPAYYSAMFEAGIPARHQSRAARGRRPRLRRAARVAEKLCAHAPRKAAAGADGGIAYLGHVARHRLAVRPWRRGAAPCRCRRKNCWRPRC